MKYRKVRTTKNSWTCKCGNFYHRSTKKCRDCKTLWDKIKDKLKDKE